MVCEEAAELEMQTQKYVDNLQEALTGTGDSGCYCFTLKPSPPTPGVSVTLTYEKVQGDISVSVSHGFQDPLAHPLKPLK